MRIALIANDTRGGVQPYAALGLGLRQAGHEVRLIAPANFATLAAESGLPFAPLSGDVEAAVQAMSGASKRSAASGMRTALREMGQQLQVWTRETLAVCADADVLTGGIGGMVVGLSVADKLGKPFVPAHLQPINAPTSAYAGVLFSGVPSWLGGWGRRLSHTLTDLALWMPFQRAMRAARQQVLGLTDRPHAAEGQPMLYGLSRAVVPLPEGGKVERHATGYWVLPTPPMWSPPPILEAFLARSEPVVSIGFGSMPTGSAERTSAIVREAIRRLGVRAVVLSGWGRLAEAVPSDDVLVLDAVPHEWLFPRVRAIVHHGGAGTTGAALRAGKPSVVVPFGVDQPFWGRRVMALGVGPQPIPFHRLSVEHLTVALRRALSDVTMQQRAAELREHLRAEDGVAAAVEVFNRYA